MTNRSLDIYHSRKSFYAISGFCCSSYALLLNVCTLVFEVQNTYGVLDVCLLLINMYARDKSIRATVLKS